jgi:Tol biopolymer transport system component
MNKKWLRHSITVFVILVFGFLAVGSGTQDKAVVTEITYDSGTLQNVTRITDDKVRKDWVSVSPDGSKMLYCETDSTNASVYAEDYKIVLLRNIATAAKTPLVNDSSYAPVWFDDNNTIVYVAFERGAGRLMKSNIGGGSKTYITRNPIGDYDANPSVHGKTILCDTFINGRRQIVSLSSDGSDVTILGEGEQPSWHPNGKKFVFIRSIPTAQGTEAKAVYEMDIAANQVTQIYADTGDKNRHGMNCSSPSYSHNGEYVLFSKGADVQVRANVTQKVAIGGGLGNIFKQTVKGEVSRWHLFVIKADGSGGASQLTSGNVNVFSPSWGVDNNIYFISTAGGATEIWRARLNLVF